MKTAVCCAVAAAAVFATSANAHGQMLEPKVRQVTDKFRADSGALKNAGNDELQWAPLENLSTRTQADFPQAATFDMMNGCRGMVYESSSPVTAFKAGATIPVKYYIQAPHPGYAEFSIVKPKTVGGKIKYERATLIKRIEDFAKSGGNFDLTLTLPSSVSGCEKAGACALQMYWHSDIANQTYVNCADITVGGSGAATGGDDAGDDTGDDAGETGGDDAGDDAGETGGDDEGDADADTTPAPAATTKPAATSAAPVDDEYSTPAPTKKKCTRRLRSRRH